MAEAAPRLAESRKGADAPKRRGRAAAAGASMGEARQGISLRDLLRREVAYRPVSRPLAVARLSPDVRAGLPRALSILFGDRRRLRWFLAAPRASRRRARGGLARAVREDRCLQGKARLELPLGVLLRKRLQL